MLVGCCECMFVVFYYGVMWIYMGDDVVGVEVGGVVKNVLVIVIGIFDGFGFGLNVCVVLIMCGFVEMLWFGVVFGGCVEIFMGFMGFGDLIFIVMGDLLCNCMVGL